MKLVALALLLAGCCGGTTDRFSWCNSGYDRWAQHCRSRGGIPHYENAQEWSCLGAAK